MPMQYYCPACFAKMDYEVRNDPCPLCGVVGEQWQREHSLTERTIHALKHPNPETRMMSIIMLGNRRETHAALPLVACAEATPADVVQNMEIVRSVIKLPDSAEKHAALERLAHHAASAVRRAIQEYRDDMASYV